MTDKTSLSEVLEPSLADRAGPKKGNSPVKRTPQERKRLSYAKDRRNSYGENDKASRKLIPLRKAQENRGNRRKAKQLSGNINRMDDADADLAQNSLLSDIERVGGWRKGADTPLGICVASQLRAREFRPIFNRRKRGLPPDADA